MITQGNRMKKSLKISTTNIKQNNNSQEIIMLRQVDLRCTNLLRAMRSAVKIKKMQQVQTTNLFTKEK